MREGEGRVIPTLRPLVAEGGVVVASLVVPARYDFPPELVTIVRLNQSRQARFEIRTLEGGAPEVLEYEYDHIKRSFTGKVGDWEISARTDHPEGSDHDAVVTFYAEELREKVKEGTA